MPAVNAINKYTPFWQYEMLIYASRQQAKIALFGELSDDEIWADFLSWLDVRHSKHLDLELIHRAATRLGGEIGLNNLDVKMQQWFLSTTHEHKQDIRTAFLDGYEYGFKNIWGTNPLK
jgi:hypothetical protein